MVMKCKSKDKINHVIFKLDNLDKITLSELFGVFAHVKIKALWTIGLGFISYTSIVGFTAMSIQESKTAIALRDPFDISIRKDAIENCTDSSKNKNLLRCKKIYLVEQHSPSDAKQLHLELRIADEHSPMTTGVGTILAKKRAERKVPFLPITLDISQPVLAQRKQDHFNWNGHKNNFDFHEKYISRNTIRRYYKDGWILEYKVDRNKRSILSTFIWIRKGRCFLNVCI